MEEHQEIDLPLDIIRPDGSFDLYEDVQNRFQIEYKAKRKRLVIRGSRWIGHVPINDRYTLFIDTRVPVFNIERVLSRSPFKKAETINYTHSYLSSTVRAHSIFDVLTDRFLDALEMIKQDGLIKRYRREQRTSPSPAGRIDPLQTKYKSYSSGRPIACYSTFARTDNTPENQIIRFALECLQSHYYTVQDEYSVINRSSRISNYCACYKHISLPNAADLSIDALMHKIDKLPFHRDSYAEALRLAHLIVSGQSVSLRGEGGMTILPAILVNMAEVFEGYVRNVLENNLSPLNISVLDGNKGNPIGASIPLFSSFYIKGNSPAATPDIVVKINNTTQLVIDAKYKLVKNLPDRADINQVICYAQRYNTAKAMLLYPASTPLDVSVTLIGNIGGISLYKGLLNLSACDLPSEEKSFSEAITALILAN